MFILLFIFVCGISKIWAMILQAAAAKGEAPPGLPLKGAGQDSSDTQPRVNSHLVWDVFLFGSSIVMHSWMFNQTG